MSLAILLHFLRAQQAQACNTDTTPTQLHRNPNTHGTKNNTTNVVIQQHSRKLLMMDILMSETFWAHKKWNKIASDIKSVFYSSTILPLVLVLSQIYRHFAFPSYFFKTNFIITLPHKKRFPNNLRLSGCSKQNPIKILLNGSLGPCHQGMARPRMLAGKDGVELRTATANITNKQSRTAEKGIPPPW